MERTRRPRRLLAALLALSAPAAAQDSVSKVHGLPGDALDAHLAAEQLNHYVVDQAALRSSWGHVFQLAPVVKHSQQRALDPQFFTALSGAQSLSRRTAAGVPFASSSYDLWSAQGAGVNDDPQRNDPGQPVDVTGVSGFRLAVAAAEFGSGTTGPTGTPASLNNVIGGLVHFTPERPSRLYVSRVVAAVNSPSDACSLSQFGLGTVDEEGSVHFRADDVGASTCGPLAPIGGQNLYRVRMAARTPLVVNTIAGPGPGDGGATDWLLAGSTTTHNTPNAIPPFVAGRPLLIGSNFAVQYVYEQSPGAVVASAPGAHFAPGVTDHRGAVGYSPFEFSSLFGASPGGTAAVLARTGSSLTTAIDAWGLGPNGDVTGVLAQSLPAVVSDPLQTWSSGDLPGAQEFDHYHSQTAFRGGTSQVAIGRDRSGNLLLAAVVYYGFQPPPLVPFNNPNNYVAVCRIAPDGAAQWSVAGWTEQSASVSDGKTIYQDATTPIGRMTGAFFGPAVSAPMIDGAGNVWFLSAIEVGGQPSVGLLRAVYDEAAFAYRLELVLQQGQVFAGLNSATAYQLRFLEVSDGDSVSSGTAWSGNLSASTWLDEPVANLAQDDNRTLGGLVLAASILYDVDGNGRFVRSTGPGGDPLSPDEDYQVLLLVTPGVDCNDNGIPDDYDVTDGASRDLDANGVPDECEGVVGLPECAGDGSLATACPCGNFGLPGRGCDNSAATGGAQLGGSGTLAPDTVVLTSDGELPTALSIFLQGDVPIANGVVFGDGVRCVGGVLKRIAVVGAVGGVASYPGPGDPGIRAVSASLGDPIPSGATRHYQVYYRDPVLGFCPNPPGNSWNVSNGFRIVWP